MALTEEQQERIRTNRERALAIRKRREEEARAKEGYGDGDGDGAASASASASGTPNTNTNNNTNTNTNTTKGGNTDNTKEDRWACVDLEEFEIDASPYISKQEAMEKYCVPKGTLEVCDYIEKDNPRNSKFSKMKLYHRSEIRRRARERFGGLQGLIEERNKREFKRFERDYDEANNIFKSARACSSAKKKRKT